MILNIVITTIFAVFIIWIVVAINNFKTWAKKRDEYYLKEISSLKSLIKTELMDLFTHLKK
jgi:hypothetical protein